MSRGLLAQFHAVFGRSALPAFMVVSYLLVLAPLILLDDAQHAASAEFSVWVVVACVYMIFAWMNVGCLRLARDARSLRLPARYGVLSCAPAVLGGVALLGFLVPCTALAIASGGWKQPGLLACGALGGWIFTAGKGRPVLNVLVSVAAGILCFRLIPVIFQGLGGTEGMLIGVIAGQVFVAVPRWRAVLVLPEESDSSLVIHMHMRRRSFVFRPGAARGRRDLLARIYLGRYFTNPGTRLQLRRHAPAALCVVLLAVLMGALFARPGPAMHGWRTQWPSLMSFAAGLPLAAAWWLYTRNFTRLRRYSGELMELALTPGLGDARAQLRWLYRATLGPPFLVIAGATVLALLARMTGVPFAPEYAAIVLIAVVSAVYCADSVVFVLSEAPIKVGQSLSVMFSPMLMVYLITMLPRDAATMERTSITKWFWMVIAGEVLAWCVIFTVRLYILSRRLAARPHPFVMP